MTIMLSNVDYSTIQLDGIDHSDYPDYCDAYICYAEHIDGSPLSEDELDKLNEDTCLINELVFESL